MSGRGFTFPFRRAIRSRARRNVELRRLVMDLGRRDFERRHPGTSFGPVLVLLASYLEADNIKFVLKALPVEVGSLAVSALVVVDGDDDGTEDIVAGAGLMCAVLPVHMGQGVALRVGYELAATHGARYVVTIDADGQDDPSAIPEHLAPILRDEADVVIGSRRLGVDFELHGDETTDKVRRLGVKVFAWVISQAIGHQVTDTTNGLRAFKIEVLDDLTLEQDQYQTAEVIISAAARGWRIAEVPIVRHPRAFGESRKIPGGTSGVRELRLFLGANVLFGLQYARVIARTWWRERRH
ncbi:MAG TPA: glycosyltransferase family 2 protein [Streptosporangiaceae bacterium]|nr:glycosyltransferase family 2 protein [Streptosporangiaceae bacterium]